MPPGSSDSLHPRNADTAAALRRTELFSRLPTEVLQQLADRSIARSLSRGEMLYSEHEEAAGLFAVAQGELRSVRQSADGREQVLSTPRAGAVLALVPVFNGGKYFTTVIADTASVVISIGHSEVHEICRRHPELLWHVARELAREIRRCAELIESLALRNVEQRVAQYLITVAHDRAVQSEAGIVFELTLTRPEIASRVASVREVISRSLAHLHERGLIVLRGARLVTIPDMEALRIFAGAPASTKLDIP